MNKRGFTLIELLAVITILSILSLIAIPNVISIIDNNKNDIILSDAQKLISLAKYRVSVDREIRESSSRVLSYEFLNENGDITVDPDGGEYNSDSSYVRYTKNGNSVNYCVTLVGSKRSIGRNSCVEESDLVRNVVEE